jgi:hypothetical protein
MAEELSQLKAALTEVIERERRQEVQRPQVWKPTPFRPEAEAVEGTTNTNGTQADQGDGQHRHDEENHADGAGGIDDDDRSTWVPGRLF